MIRLSDSAEGRPASGHQQEIGADVNQHDQQWRQLINGISPSPLLIYQLHFSPAFINRRMAQVTRQLATFVPQAEQASLSEGCFVRL
jgi:hypothetical protein